MPQLGVNIDHVATLRQARRGIEPDPVWAAVEAQLAGADGITLHLREDRRHIQDRDLRTMKDLVQVKLNLEMAMSDEIIAIALDVQLTKGEHDMLNPVGVNCVRAFPGRGIRVWGARTLSSDPAWRYLNVRRLFNYLEESILNGTQWVVFEPNDDALWARIRRTISAFLVNEWRKGALFGLTPDEAFYVKCDRETNPAEAIDAGQVTCQVGVAPVKPAEFVVFQLAQFSGGTSLVSE